MILPLLAAGVVVLLAGSLGIALYAAIPATAALPQPEDSAGAARRCAACGRIESLGELDASFTVRMSDGSSRVFQDAAVGWRLGERLIYIDGARESP